VTGRSATAAGPALAFFADRSLGSFVVPGALRAAGWTVETMDERYGPDKSPAIKDVQWIEDAAGHGDVILCKDLRIASNPLEAAAVHRTSARAFGLARRDVDGPTMISYFLSHQQQIFHMATRAEGPYVVSISQNGLRRVRLNLASPTG
jgi:hypothetical protein